MVALLVLLAWLALLPRALPCCLPRTCRMWPRNIKNSENARAHLGAGQAMVKGIGNSPQGTRHTRSSTFRASRCCSRRNLLLRRVQRSPTAGCKRFQLQPNLLGKLRCSPARTLQANITHEQAQKSNPPQRACCCGDVLCTIAEWRRAPTQGHTAWHIADQRALAASDIPAKAVGSLTQGPKYVGPAAQYSASPPKIAPTLAWAGARAETCAHALSLCTC